MVHTHVVGCPVCGESAVIALDGVDLDTDMPAVDPSGIGLTCPNLCRPTMAQMQNLFRPPEPDA